MKFGLLLHIMLATTAVSASALSAATGQTLTSPIANTADSTGGFAALVARVQPAVVTISAAQRVTQRVENPFAGTPLGEMFDGVSRDPVTRDALSLGSGFLVSPDGYIVTNDHVLAGGVGDDARGVVLQSVTITMADRTRHMARIVARDANADLAVLKIDALRPLPFVRFGDSQRVRVGDWVIAVGNPFALGGTVTAGIVSAIHRAVGLGPYHRFIQTDAAINSGNSGGPLFNMAGEVVGINNIIQASGGGGNLGIGFAIPSEEARPVVDVLMKGGRVRRGYLGVVAQPVDETIAEPLKLPPDQGEILATVEPGSPAARAGLRQGDVVTRVGAEAVTPDSTLTYLVAGMAPGTHVPIELLRDGSRTQVTATLAERPTETRIGAAGSDNEGANPPDVPAVEGIELAETLGARVEPLTPALASRLKIAPGTSGVVVAAVTPTSDLANKGVRQGDVIRVIDQRPISSVASASAAVAAATRVGRTTVLLLVERNGQPTYLGVKLGKGG